MRRLEDTLPLTSNRCSALHGPKLWRCLGCVGVLTTAAPYRVVDVHIYETHENCAICVCVLLLGDGNAGAVTTTGHGEDAHILLAKSYDGDSHDAEDFEDTIQARILRMLTLFCQSRGILLHTLASNIQNVFRSP